MILFFFFDKQGTQTDIKRHHRHPNQVGIPRDPHPMPPRSKKFIKKGEKNKYKRRGDQTKTLKKQKEKEIENKQKKQEKAAKKQIMGICNLEVYSYPYRNEALNQQEECLARPHQHWSDPQKRTYLRSCFLHGKCGKK